ncbi:MAG: hypothetical protein M4579_003527 [Chaenotheca gracillima]|nr:MAG: hypothetical protein M4579_003527 [Chaenotheca gracillima]
MQRSSSNEKAQAFKSDAASIKSTSTASSSTQLLRKDNPSQSSPQSSKSDRDRAQAAFQAEARATYFALRR